MKQETVSGRGSECRQGDTPGGPVFGAGPAGKQQIFLAHPRSRRPKGAPYVRRVTPRPKTVADCIPLRQPSKAMERVCPRGCAPEPGWYGNHQVLWGWSRPSRGVWWPTARNIDGRSQVPHRSGHAHRHRSGCECSRASSALAGHSFRKPAICARLNQVKT